MVKRKRKPKCQVKRVLTLRLSPALLNLIARSWRKAGYRSQSEYAARLLELGQDAFVIKKGGGHG